LDRYSFFPEKKEARILGGGKEMKIPCEKRMFLRSGNANNDKEEEREK